jgi:hypothetical protein
MPYSHGRRGGSRHRAVQTTGRRITTVSQAEAHPLGTREAIRHARWQEGAEVLNEEILRWREKRHRFEVTPKGFCSKCLTGPAFRITKVRAIDGYPRKVYLHTDYAPPKETP